MKTGTAIVLTGSVIIACIFTIVIDHVFIRLWADSIAIPRSTRMMYKTTEFEYTVDTNSMGFRDREFILGADPSVIKIAVLGDSFTYGWGVAEEESWPRILENILRENGYPAVVMNLAKPGYFPFMYASYAAQYLPDLKPDIVLVGVLQGDDLLQMDYGDCGELKENSRPETDTAPAIVSIDHSSGKSRRHPAIAYLKSALAMLYPNIMRARSYKARTQSEHLSTIWKRMAEGLLSSFSPGQAERFSRLETHARDMFLRGDLNPTLIQMAVVVPDLLKELSYLDSAKTIGLINRMAECLLAIKQEGERCSAHATAVVSIPYGIYTCKKSYANREHLGLHLDPSMLTDDNADTAISMACGQAGIPFISIFDAFRKKAAQDDLFFIYDGHFNAQGHSAYAELIAPAIIAIISRELSGKQLAMNAT